MYNNITSRKVKENYVSVSTRIRDYSRIAVQRHHTRSPNMGERERERERDGNATTTSGESVADAGEDVI